MQRIKKLLNEKDSDLLSVYYTAGFPNLEDTIPILRSLEKAGADLVEIGMPYSDPLADGPTIQDSSTQALNNGMHLQLLFKQLEGVRSEVTVPIILMGYLNPIIQFGMEAFCAKCAEVGVDGLILPDLPMEVYEEEFRPVFNKYGLFNIFLITPQTSEERIRAIDEMSEGFIYMVSTAGTTGARQGVREDQKAYFKRVEAMELSHPTLIGFGISDNQSFTEACKYSKGAIIGSAFIKHLSSEGADEASVQRFVDSIKQKSSSLN
ncbi:MAG: tryptophan synthase subunit alpha [Cyclobacteriaceae bacterium]|nr:tryptophan synthase subunit alpha [Cyclobacteriaceae bacterium]MCH8516963.1 tryptophan synthase subunit alpha [Cyclobacteriaceae bacterium]